MKNSWLSYFSVKNLIEGIWKKYVKAKNTSISPINPRKKRMVEIPFIINQIKNKESQFGKSTFC